MDKSSHLYVHYIWDEITDPCHNFNRGLAAVEVRSWISDHIHVDQWEVITYPCPFL